MNSLLFFFVVSMFAGIVLLAVVARQARREELVSERIGRYLNRAVAQKSTRNPWRAEQLEGNRAKLQQALAQAGFHTPQALNSLIAAKVVSAVIALWLCAISLAEPTSTVGIAQCIAAAVVGGIVPEWLLAWRGRKVLRRIRAGLADTIDLMVICLEAGMTIEKSLARVGAEFESVNPQLARQLQLLASELRMLPERSEVLQRFKWRLPLEEVEQWVFSLEQAERFGSPLGPVLRTFSADLRARNALRIEEELAKIPARMGLPLMILVLLPLIVVIAGPAVIQLLAALQGT
ncbi:MAG: type II secretion system F family protein [Pseudomonadales bacterium]